MPLVYRDILKQEIMKTNICFYQVLWRRIDVSFPLTVGAMTVVEDDRFQVGHVDYKSQWDLMIKNVQPEDEGIYECQVASRDRTMRRLITLTVLGKLYHTG